MNVLVALGAKSYKIFCGIIPLVAAPFDVVDLKAFHPPTPLATPAVSLQNLPAELAISFRVKL